MPHDIVAPEFSIGDPELDSPPEKKTSPILAAMKEAGRALMTKAKRSAPNLILSAMMAAGALLAAPQPAGAQSCGGPRGCYIDLASLCQCGGPGLPNGFTLGDSLDRPGSFSGGDPVDIATGNVFLHVVDYTTAGQNPLQLIRYFNSTAETATVNTLTYAFGNVDNGSGSPVYTNRAANIMGGPAQGSPAPVNWRTNYDRFLQFSPATSPTTVIAERADGQQVTFTLSGSTWTPPSCQDYTLTQSGSTWILKDHNDTTESYTNSGAGWAELNTITYRDGYQQTLSYGSSPVSVAVSFYTSAGGVTAFYPNELQSVTDSYGRSLNFAYTSGTNKLLETVSTPDSLVLTYGYTFYGTNAPYYVNNAGYLLTSVSYNTSPVTSQTYAYDLNSQFPYGISTITDENGNTAVAWGYAAFGQATASQQGNSGLYANYTSFVYGNTSTTLTNVFNVSDTYNYTILNGAPAMTSINRAATATTAAANEYFGYDANGFMNSFTDWNGNQTTMVNNAQGNPTTINYAVGSPVAYSDTISYDPTWIRLPHQIIAPGITSTFVYDGNGNPLNRTDVDTTTTSIPYSTNGQSRETQWTWSSTGQLESVQLPRTDVTAKTSFGYDSTGALTSITDAASHITHITAHTGGGYPETIVDPNGVTTKLVWDTRLNLNTVTVDTSLGNFTTTYSHDPANNLSSIARPDSSELTFGRDTANRLTSVTDLFGNVLTLTLDYLGDATATTITNSGTTYYSSSATFDALGRKLSFLDAYSDTTSYTWDPNSNLLTIAPPAPQGTITRTVDALNRLSTSADPSPGGTTTYTWNSFNQPLSQKDANGNSTTYVYDGFQDRIQALSPDSGSKVFYYNGDRDVTQMTLPGSITDTNTFDALDRLLTVKWTGDTTLNVTNTYDQSGHGDGIGRLTSVKDQLGRLALTWDERGNVTKEVRTPTGLTALTTQTAFDSANDVQSITYPSGTFVQYARDIMGRVSGVTATPSGGSPQNVATGIGYEPLPAFAEGLVSGLTYGNGITGTYGFDQAYRASSRTDIGTATIQNLAYAYYPNNSVQTITDAVNAANTQNLNYDALDRLSSATSGSGGYGSFSWTWDANSNVKTQVQNGTTTMFGYTSGSDLLSQFKTGGTIVTVSETPSGNATTFKVGSATQEALTYNDANQLATATAGTKTATYYYDLLGRRSGSVGSSTGTSVFQYAHTGDLLTDNDGSGNDRVDYIYIDPNKPSRLIGTYEPTTNAFYFLSVDRLGTPTVATDSTQTVQWSATYQPFGSTPTGASGIVQNLRLPGQEWDLESTLNHNGFRNYATTLTRYAEADPIGAGLAAGKAPNDTNPYTYVKGNPFKYTDRAGLDPNGGGGDDACSGGSGSSGGLSFSFIGSAQAAEAGTGTGGGCTNQPSFFQNLMTTLGIGAMGGMLPPPSSPEDVGTSVEGSLGGPPPTPLALPTYMNTQTNTVPTITDCSPTDPECIPRNIPPPSTGNNSPWPPYKP